MAAAKLTAPAANKTECPINKETFKAKAKPLNVTINGVPLPAMPHEFSTGSFGWYLNGKITVEVDGVNVPVQIGCNITAVGSKPEKAKL
jgi:hypothetical protein